MRVSQTGDAGLEIGRRIWETEGVACNSEKSGDVGILNLPKR